MRLSDASVVIRPRTSWEAMDLGVLMAQEHRLLLMASWALVSLPIFIALSVLLWQYPSTALFVFWWLKPAFDRLPLYILSKALFGETPSLKQAVRHWPRLLKGQLLASLTWRRLSLSRSFLMPVSQLEGLDGQARQKRLGVLQQHNAGAARWLTTLGVHLEIGLWFGCMALFYLFIPQQVELDWDWQRLALATGPEGLWLEHLSNAFYALVLVFWEPIYVACGFSLYLNRRTVLEAWDLELVFRRLRQRLSSAAPLLLLVIGLMLLPLGRPAMADDSPPPGKSPPNPPANRSRRCWTSLRSKIRKPSRAIALLTKNPTPSPRHAVRANYRPGCKHCWTTSTATPSSTSPKAWRCCCGVCWRAAWRCSPGVIASGCAPLSAGAGHANPSSPNRHPPNCSAWSWAPKPCPMTLPAPPSDYGPTTPGKHWACCIAGYSVGYCTTSTCH